MLQIDHVYEFFYQNIFSEFCNYSLSNGVFNKKYTEVSYYDINIFNMNDTTSKIFFIDQEPIIESIVDPYIELFNWPDPNKITLDDLMYQRRYGTLPYLINNVDPINLELHEHNKTLYKENPKLLFKDSVALIVSERSNTLKQISKNQNINTLYYFFHGFAALDWFRGYYTLNHNKKILKSYLYDFVSFNRLVSHDRSYRCYFVSKLIEKDLLKFGQVSFGNNTDSRSWQEEIDMYDTKLSKSSIDHIRTHLNLLSDPLIIDDTQISGFYSADIPRQINDSFWHIVTETVFYYNKLHLTEKIFKPIVMKQPFMLLGAPGNLEYLRSYGFKTFDGIIDESYDRKVNPDARVEAVVEQLNWYCNLSDTEKLDVMRAVEPIVEYNFHHFYGEFKHIITKELLDNCKDLFKKIGYDDSNIAYCDIYKTLVN